jgi:hypothetical protein
MGLVERFVGNRGNEPQSDMVEGRKVPEAFLLQSLQFDEAVTQKPRSSRYFCMVLWCSGARGGAVVEALRYKPEGRGIDFEGCHWTFSLT